MKRIVSLVAVAILSGCATVGSASNPVWLSPAGVEDEAATALAQACLDQTADVRAPRGPTPYSPPSNGAAGAMGAAFGAGLAQGLADGQARRDAMNQCLAGSGFVPVLLTPDQARAWRALTDGAERRAYLEEIAAEQKPGAFVPFTRPEEDTDPARPRTDAEIPAG